MSLKAISKLVTFQFPKHFNCSVSYAKRMQSKWYVQANKSQMDDMVERIENRRIQEESVGMIDTNNAAKIYLENVKSHEKFMREKVAEFQIGRRHLANMMGEDPDTFTQEDINKAIEYLLPSGLFVKEARPRMLPPEDVFPEQKSAQFDIKGRPFHCFFYTNQANMFQVMHDITTNMKALDKFQDRALIRSGPVAIVDRVNLGGTEWISKEELEKKVLEHVPNSLYEKFLMAMDRLCSHPYSAEAKEFIMQFRKEMNAAELKLDIVEPTVSEDGRRYVVAVGTRKNSKAIVKLIEGGKGYFNINGKSILYFKHPSEREQILLPLQLAGLMNSVDVVCEVVRGGESGQAGAIRYAISVALQSFVDSATQQKMRLAGLLTLDRRRNERKKPGQKGARAKFTWKKR